MIKLVQLLHEGVNDPGIFKAIFLAGGPGSGKTYIAKGLFGIPERLNISQSGMKMVNSDKELKFLLNKYGFGTMDAAAYGTSSTMDIFSSLYKHTFMSDDFNMIPMGHSVIPFYMKYIGLNMGESQISQNLINKIRKPEEFKKLIGDTNV